MTGIGGFRLARLLVLWSVPAVLATWPAGAAQGGFAPGAVLPEVPAASAPLASSVSGSLADQCVEIPLIDDRCETWLFAHDEEDFDVVAGIAMSPDGRRVYITGFVFDSLLSTKGAAVTVAVDTDTGEGLWSARYDGPAGLRDQARAIGVSPDGERVYVAGDRDQGGAVGTGDLTVIAYDAVDGDKLWVTAHDGPDGESELAHSLVVGPGAEGDRVYVAGTNADLQVAERRDYLVAALDGPTGDVLWAAQHGGPGGGWDEAVDVEVDRAGERVFVTGFVSGGPSEGRNYGTVAYDSGIHDTAGEKHGGELLWAAYHDGPAHGTDQAYDLAVSPGGDRVFVTGGSEVASGDEITLFDSDYVTLAYDASDGTLLWSARFDGGSQSHDRTDIARSLAVSPDGTLLFVTGLSVQLNFDFVTLAYDTATGEEAWPAPARLLAPNPASIDIPYTVVSSPDGSRVYVTGQSAVQVSLTLPESYVQSDALTASYDAESGDRLWVARHNSSELGIDSYFSRSGSWTSLAISPANGAVFVARTFERHTDKFLGNPNPQDYGVVRYDG